jgi:uncharacterized membrane protein YhhN
MTGLASAWALGCAACVAALLVADRWGSAAGRVLFKLGASSCFVAVALVLDAPASGYGQAIVAALLLGWVGDAALLSRRPAAFMAGLGAFLLSHAAYAAAFVGSGVALPALAVGLLPAALVGWAVLRWLLPHVPAGMRWPVLAYVVVILVMCVAAAGHAAASGQWVVLAGAVSFTASDLSVARDRFVQPAFVNRLWGWPTYFAAQLLLAWSVAGRAPG